MSTRFREELVQRKKFTVPPSVPWGICTMLSTTGDVHFSVGPFCSGELPPLGENPRSATSGGVPESWTRGERGVKDLEIASKK